MPATAIAGWLGRERVQTIVLLLIALGSPPVQAGLFDDDEARRQLKDLSIKTNDRLDTVSKGQIELANQIQTRRDENARLRGQVETLTYELESARKRQQDFYVRESRPPRTVGPKPEEARGGNTSYFYLPVIK